jgi:hypothetical protein
MKQFRFLHHKAYNIFDELIEIKHFFILGAYLIKLVVCKISRPEPLLVGNVNVSKHVKKKTDIL